MTLLVWLVIVGPLVIHPLITEHFRAHYRDRVGEPPGAGGGGGGGGNGTKVKVGELLKDNTTLEHKKLEEIHHRVLEELKQENKTKFERKEEEAAKHREEDGGEGEDAEPIEMSGGGEGGDPAAAEEGAEGEERKEDGAAESSLPEDLPEEAKVLIEEAAAQETVEDAAAHVMDSAIESGQVAQTQEGMERMWSLAEHVIRKWISQHPVGPGGTSVAVLEPEAHDHQLRFLGDVPESKNVALRLFSHIEKLPLVSTHAQVSPHVLLDKGHSGVTAFGDPVDLFVMHNLDVLRIMHSQGVSLEGLGVSVNPSSNATVETDPRVIWQNFADNFFRLRGTTSSLWVREAFRDVFHVNEVLDSENAQEVYDMILEQLSSREFSPSALLEEFNIEVLCSKNPATANLSIYSEAEEQLGKKLRPTFHPDNLFRLRNPGWKGDVQLLAELTGVDIASYAEFLEALKLRRREFKERGAVATDHETEFPHAEWRSDEEMESYFAAAMARRDISPKQEAHFKAHMLMEMAKMSTEDRLVMQLHTGIRENHDRNTFTMYKHGVSEELKRINDMPASIDFSSGLYDLLNEFGNHPNFTLVLFSSDESTYTRALGPLAGHYPAVKVGAPWWFLSSPRAMRKFLTEIVEIAGIQNLAGFNDDASMLLALPLRHLLWRRVVASWAAGLVVNGEVEYSEASDITFSLAYGLAKDTYNLGAAEGPTGPTSAAE